MMVLSFFILEFSIRKFMHKFVLYQLRKNWLYCTGQCILKDYKKKSFHQAPSQNATCDISLWKSHLQGLSKQLQCAQPESKIPPKFSQHFLKINNTFTSCFRFFPSEPIQEIILGRFTPPARLKVWSNRDM